MRIVQVFLPILVALALAAPLGNAVPAADPPAPEKSALLTLTAIPGGWGSRTDLRPVLRVYADGRAVESPDGGAPDRKPGTPAREREGHIPQEAIAAAVTEIKELASLDFGMPPDNSQGLQLIDLIPENPAESVHAIVYAPGFIGNLTAEQRSARQRFTDIYNRLRHAFVADR